MSDITLLLGPVAFQEFELPSNIGFGGEQRLAIHRLPGGPRIIDALGRDDSEITFSGIFSGPDATLRARMLDTLRAEGMPLPLTWDVFFYTVILRCFEADYRAGWWIPYRITCTVLRDEGGALIDAGISLATSVISDIGQAAVQAISGGIDLSGAQAALNAPNASMRGTLGFKSAQASLSAAQASINAGVNTGETGLTSAATVLTDADTAQDGIVALNGATENARQLALLTNARGYLGRAAVNLANAST